MIIEYVSARVRSYLMLLVVAVIWGFAGPIIKYTLNFFDPVTFLTYRFLQTCLILIPLLLILEPRIWQHLSRFTPSEWTALIISGLLGSTVNLGLLFWGYSLTTAIDATLINDSLSPILVALAGHFILREHITERERLGLFIALTGSVIIIVQPWLESGKLFSGSLSGNLIIFFAALSWAGYSVITKKSLKNQPSPLLLTASSFLFGFISMSVIALIFHRPFEMYHRLLSVPVGGHLGVLYMSVLSGALAYFLFQRAQKTIETSEANVFLYLPPIFATPLAYFWLGESVTFTFLTGALVIAAGVYVAETKKRSVGK